MKLSDIDAIVTAKNNYRALKEQLSQIEKNAPYELAFFNMSQKIQHRVVLGRCKEIALEVLRKDLELATTKLAMFGVTDFEN